MNVNKILPFLLLLPFLASCTSKYKIEGTSSVNSLDGKMLYLKSLRDGEWVKLDSAEVVHGLFSMKGKIYLTGRLPIKEWLILNWMIYSILLILAIA